MPFALPGSISTPLAAWNLGEISIGGPAQMGIYQLLPPEGVKIVLVLFLSFLIGLEREEHKAARDTYSFGGIRTFPLIGLIGANG